MKALGLMALGAAMAMSAEAGAQQRAGGGPRITIPSHSNHFSWERGHGFKRGFFPVLVVEREVVRVVEVPVAAPPPVAKELGTPNRDVPKPHVIGKSYASLPDGCMKLIEGGTSYYHCDGEWYRQVGERRYVGVAARKL